MEGEVHREQVVLQTFRIFSVQKSFSAKLKKDTQWNIIHGSQRNFVEAMGISVLKA
jgi:hypothetical protein